MAIDIDTFKPTSVGELLSATLQTATAAAGSSWKDMKEQVENHLNFISKIAFDTLNRLKKGEINARQADHTFHLLEYNLNSTLLLIEIVPHVVAQSVLTSVFALLNAAVKNVTGIDLGYGKS